jgi:hypothetical protein
MAISSGPGDMEAASRVENDMRVGPSKAKRVDADPLMARLGPRRWLQRNSQLAFLKRDFRVGARKLYVWGDGLVFETQHGLDQRRDAGRSLRMAQIRFNRANEDARVPTKYPSNGLGLERVPDGGSGPMAFHKGRLGEVGDPGHLVRLPDHGLLALGAGNRDALCLSVAVGHGASNHSTNWVPVPYGSVQRLDIYGRDGLASGVSVRIGREGLARSFGREDALFRHESR